MKKRRDGWDIFTSGSPSLFIRLPGMLAFQCFFLIVCSKLFIRFSRGMDRRTEEIKKKGWRVIT